MKRVLACWALVALALAGWAPSAGAIGGGMCRITGRIAFSPQGATGGQWTIENGVMNCVGTLAGGRHRFVGPGQFRGSGSYTSSVPSASGACLQQAGKGMVEWHVPTTGGYLVANEPNDYTLVGIGSFTTPSFRGSFQLAPPYNGDCVSKPVTGAAFVAEAALYRGVEPGTPG